MGTRERREQVELLRRQPDGIAGNLDRTSGQIDDHIPGRNARRASNGRNTPHHRLDARQQLGEGERLDEVVVGSAAQSLDARGQVSAGGHDDHRPAAEAPQASTQLQPVAVGQAKIEQDEIGRLRTLDRIQRLGGTARAACAVPARGQAIAQRGCEPVVVLDHQDAHQATLDVVLAFDLRGRSNCANATCKVTSEGARER